jgi:hypothetical protein
VSSTPTRSTDTPWSTATWAFILAALTLATLSIHGYHPLAEDGGLYVAGIEYLLDRTLFPHYTAFVQEHLRFSLFAPTLAALIRLTHIPLLWMLFLLNLFSIALTLFAAHQILRRLTLSRTRTNDRIQLAGLALFAAWWTLPIAGTSLYLMDPYLTARSFSTPLTLLAIAFALDSCKPTQPIARPLLRSLACIALAATMHPLMAGYALAFVIVLCISRPSIATKQRTLALLLCTGLAILTAALIQATSPAESPALHAAILTRYYWFLSQWQWFEILGLVGPLAVFAALLHYRAKHFAQSFRTLCKAAITLGILATLIAVLFARENLQTHRIASLQPLRIFLPIYALMAPALGAALQQALECRAPARRLYSAAFIVAMAAIMLFVQRQTYTRSPQVELPASLLCHSAAQRSNLHVPSTANNACTTNNPRLKPHLNPWSRAFLWACANTPRDALFALDAKYVNLDGEDAQTFRATSLRSAIPDYSKDGGEAAITPALAPEWLAASSAQKDLSHLDDATRNARLSPFHVTWMVLQSSAATSHPCPYNNGTVKVCMLTPQPY